MNIAEIAKRAGVSSATVSRYFNHGYISEGKKVAIRRVVEETGYHPSVQAQTLRTKKTKMIGVILPKIASTSMGSVVAGILSGLEAEGYRLLLADTQSSPKKELEYLSVFDEKQVDGVILAATVLTKKHKSVLKKMAIPIVIVGQRLEGYPHVFHDDYHAIYDMTRLVLRRGCQRLGYISAFHEDKAAGAARFRGYSDAVREAGLPELKDNYVIADFTIDSGYEKTKELLERCGRLDAIICASDEMAAGALRCARDMQIDVPGQMLVTGHGDSDLAKVISPMLPTVHYFYEESGYAAAQMMLEILKKGQAGENEIRMGYSIVNWAE
ncbi:LacI family DNA-binding transcriptional regulator [Roseburia hominis]